MDEKMKPLKAATNKLKDLKNTYLKQEEGRSIPISEPETEKQQAAGEEILQGKTDETVETAQYEEISSEELDSLNLEIFDLRQRIADLEKERDDFREQTLRKSAEIENIRRRSLKEKQELIDFANERLIFRLLETLDDINAAVSSSEKTEDFNSLVTGIKMIQAKTLKIFEEYGVKPMDSAIGRNFDVNYHEAVALMPSEFPEGQVVHEIQSGYYMHDKVIRHAKVITSSGELPNQ